MLDNRRLSTLLLRVVASAATFALLFVLGILLGDRVATTKTTNVLPATVGTAPHQARTVPAAGHPNAHFTSSPTHSPGAAAEPDTQPVLVPFVVPSAAPTPAAVPESSPGATPGPPPDDTVDGHAIYQDIPALPGQIYHFVDPCATPGPSDCPSGVGGTVLLDDHPDPLAGPLVITSVDLAGWQPTPEQVACTAEHVGPVAAGSRIYAITSNNPAHFSVADIVTGDELARADTSDAAAAAFDNSEMAGRMPNPVVTCIDVPSETTRWGLVTGRDRNLNDATARVHLGPEALGERPPVVVTAGTDSTDPLAFHVAVPVRTEQHETAFVQIIHEPAAAVAPGGFQACPVQPESRPDNVPVFGGLTIPLAVPAGGTFSPAYSHAQAFSTRLTRPWESNWYVFCVYWYQQQQSFSTPRIIDAQSINVYPISALAWDATITSATLENGQAVPLNRIGVELGQHGDPNCQFNLDLAAPETSVPHALCTISTDDTFSNWNFSLTTLFGGAPVVSDLYLPKRECWVTRTLPGLFGPLPGNGERRCWSLERDVTFPFGENGPKGNLVVHFHGHLPAPGLFTALNTSARNPIPGAGRPPTPSALHAYPALDLFHTSLIVDAADPVHYLRFNWEADRAVTIVLSYDGYDHTTCAQTPPVIAPTTVAAAGGSIRIGPLCSGTNYVLSAAITDATGHRSTYSLDPAGVLMEWTQTTH